MSPTSLGLGAGYRVPVGDSLAMRFEGRLQHFSTEDGGNALVFAVSIGGLFGHR